MLAVWTAVHQADGLEDVQTLDDMRRSYATLVNCDPAARHRPGGGRRRPRRLRSRLLAGAIGGRALLRAFGFVHPDWRRRGIGRPCSATTRHGCARSPPSTTASRRNGSAPQGVETDAGNVALLRGDGYAPVRYLFDMVARRSKGSRRPPMPDGLEVRPTTRDQYRALWDAANEAFRDEWGHSPADRRGLAAFPSRSPERRSALLAHRLGRRPHRRRDHDDRPDRGERAVRPLARLCSRRLGAPPLAPSGSRRARFCRPRS